MNALERNFSAFSANVFGVTDVLGETLLLLPAALQSEVEKDLFNGTQEAAVGLAENSYAAGFDTSYATDRKTKDSSLLPALNTLYNSRSAFNNCTHPCRTV